MMKPDIHYRIPVRELLQYVFGIDILQDINIRNTNMNRKKILIIEDELIHGYFLKYAMEKSGYHVIDIISTGEDAVGIAIAQKPDLIITDIVLKGKLSGVDALEEINRHAKIPFILLTAHNECAFNDRSTVASPYAIINKPYDDKVLIEVIDSLFK